MCIVLDTNILPCVFDKGNAYHDDFSPVWKWIFEGKGKVVFGGSKYLIEIGKFRKLFIQLRNAGKAHFADNDKVDDLCSKLENAFDDDDYDDPHLIALIQATKCRLIASRDKRAFKYFRHPTFYTSAKDKPKIYRGFGNKSLLCDKNIAEVCKPCIKTTKAQKKTLDSL